MLAFLETRFVPYLRDASPANVIKYLSHPGRILSSLHRLRFRRCSLSSSIEPYLSVCTCRLHIRMRGARGSLSRSLSSSFEWSRERFDNVRRASSGDGGGCADMVKADALFPLGICSVWTDDLVSCSRRLVEVAAAVLPKSSRSSSSTNSSKESC